MKNINSRALTLAHEIKAAYSSFRLALIAAYKVIKSKSEHAKLLNALDKVAQLLSTTSLHMVERYNATINAWLAVFNLDYLD